MASNPLVDTVNLAQGWCSITPIGSFDWKWGGQLVLKELGLVIDFPPSSTILIPSALITHPNAPVKDHETWFSIVQYTAGGLFRWVDNGFMSDKAWDAVAAPKQTETHARDKVERLKRGMEMFTQIEELLLGNCCNM
jgi:hypothetical protein